MNLHILLVAGSPETGQNLLEKIAECGASGKIVHSLTEAYHELTRQPYHGLLLDLPITVRATRDEKALVHDLLGRIPVLRVRWDPIRQKVSSILYCGSRSVELCEFLNTICDPANPVRIRRASRLPLHLNLLLASDPDQIDQNPERAACLNMSEEGCFILTGRDSVPGETLWLRFPTLSDTTLIEVDVRWSIPWGESQRLPGIGVRFRKLTASQREEIAELLHPSPRAEEALL